MIKKYTHLVFAFLLSFALVSEETGRHEMHAFYFMQVSNPPAIVGAILTRDHHVTAELVAPTKHCLNCTDNYFSHRE